MTEPWTSPSAEDPYAAPPPSGTPQHGTPQYGPPQYGPPQYGAPAWGSPAPPSPGRSRGPLLVAGIVVAVLVLAAVGLSAVGLVLAGRSGSAARAERSVSVPAGPSVAPTPVDPLDLRTGDCFLSEGLSERIDQVPVVPCTQEHDTEMSGTVTLPETPWPGADRVDELSDDACLPMFESYVGIPFDDSDLDYSYITPRRETWESGDRLVICLVTTADGTVATPMAGSRA